jgi:hypothetical protein
MCARPGSRFIPGAQQSRGQGISTVAFNESNKPGAEALGSQHAFEKLGRGMPAQHGVGASIGFLQFHVPIFQLFKRNRDPRHGAAHEGSRLNDAEIPVKKLELCFACHGGGSIKAVKHSKPPKRYGGRGFGFELLLAAAPAAYGEYITLQCAR